MSAGPLPAGCDRFSSEIGIVDPGACNPSGVALAILNASRQVISEGGYHPPRTGRD